jgi:hypothetical protein
MPPDQKMMIAPSVFADFMWHFVFLTLIGFFLRSMFDMRSYMFIGYAFILAFYISWVQRMMMPFPVYLAPPVSSN